jgi:hypothetical protein
MIDRVPKLSGVSGGLRQELRNKLIDHGRYVRGALLSPLLTAECVALGIGVKNPKAACD